MTMAASLPDAANLSYAQANLSWVAATLKADLAAFVAEVSPFFEDAVPNNRPVGNWLVLMSALSTAMSSVAVSNSDFDTAVEYLFRICYAGVIAGSQGRITGAQSAGLLAAWNTHFGT